MTVDKTVVAGDNAGYGSIDFLSDSLAYSIKQAQVRVYENLFEFLGPESLTPGRMTALCIIGNQPGIKQSELAEQLRVNRASVVKVIDSLQAAGYVDRGIMPGDRRSHALVVTDQGYAELRRLTQLVRQHDALIASGLTPSERDTLMRLIAKVAQYPADDAMASPAAAPSSAAK